MRPLSLPTLSLLRNEVSATPSSGPELPAYTGVLAHHDAGEITGLSNGDALASAWADLTGNGNDLALTSGSPTWRAADFAGLPAVRMAAGDIMESPTLGMAKSSWGILMVTHDLNPVATNNSSRRNLLVIGAPFFGAYDNGTHWYYTTNGFSNFIDVEVGNPTFLDGENLVAILKDGSNVGTIEKNGVSSGSGNVGGGSYSKLRLNGGGIVNDGFGSWDHAEIVVVAPYDATVIAEWETYLAAKYGITLPA